MFRVAAAAPPNVNPTLLFWMLTAADGRVPEGIIAPEEIYGIVSIAYAVLFIRVTRRRTMGRKTDGEHALSSNKKRDIPPARVSSMATTRC